MSNPHLHIMANKGDVAETVLLPGDPLRAKFIAENFLTDAKCYNEVRGMYGFTGIYKGQRISVQGTGMGLPSTSIYINELITFYDAKNLIRVGSCGSITEEIPVRSIILAMSASSTSGINRRRFPWMDYAPTANFDLLKKAYDVAQAANIDVKVGSVLSKDLFYDDAPTDLKVCAQQGILALEMETSELYTTSVKHGVRALSILTVSDNIATGEETTPQERQETFTDMMKLALELA